MTLAAPPRCNGWSVVPCEPGFFNNPKGRCMKMSVTTSSAHGILHGICEVVNRTSVYSSLGGEVEVERLFLLGTSFAQFLARVASTRVFTSKPLSQQQAA